MTDRDEAIKDGERAIAMLGEVEEPTPWCDFIRVSFENALALLREHEKDGWISVKDRLPPNDDTKVLTYGNPVTHWMYLPEPPEVES